MITLVTRTMATTPPKKRRRYYSSFNNEWIKTYDFVLKSKKGESYAFCTICSADFSINHGGKYGIEKHRDTDKHKQFFKLRAENVKMRSFFTSSASSDVNHVTKAEVLFCEYLAEHNLPFAAADHFSKLAKVMYPYIVCLS